MLSLILVVGVSGSLGGENNHPLGASDQVFEEISAFTGCNEAVSIVNHSQIIVGVQVVHVLHVLLLRNILKLERLRVNEEEAVVVFEEGKPFLEERSCLFLA